MMRLPFADSWRALTRPGTAFVHPPPPLGQAVGAMALVWVPLALLNAGLTSWRALHAYAELQKGILPSWWPTGLGGNPADLQDLLLTLPAPPAWSQLWPWLLLVVPVGVIGTWLHHAVWDHTGLWMLGGLKEKRGFRVSLIAEAEALRYAAVGTLVGLLSFVPVLWVALTLPLLLLDGYLWLFRGFALAARHGCEPWRGMAATVVHAVLLGGCALGLLLLMIFMVRVAI